MTLNYKVVDNFLPEGTFQILQNNILNPQTGFQWSFFPSVSHKQSDDGVYFVHIFYGDPFITPGGNEHFKNGISCYYYDFIFDTIKCMMTTDDEWELKSLMRCKANLYTQTPEIKEHDWHCDRTFSHKGAILYINNNDGYTILEDGTKIESVANRMLFFDPSIKHRSTTCTDKLCRLNINFNYF